MGYKGICGPKAHCFSGVLVIIGVLILAILVLNRVRFLYKGGKFLKKLWCCVGGSIAR